MSMKKEEWQKAYAPKRNALDIRVKNTLASQKNKWEIVKLDTLISEQEEW